MNFLEMRSELAQAIPGMSRIYAGTLINRAWREVRDSTLWSFQLQQGGFATPALTNVGSVTVFPNTPIIVGDAAATAAWQALPFQFSPTKQQFRVLGYSIYSIMSWDNGTDPINSPNYPFATLTLDRNFIDPLVNNTGNGYRMMMCYLPAPTPDFKRWLNISDMFNCYALDVWTSRRTINQMDPARLYTSNPTAALGMGQDARYGSATLGYQLYELWPNPTTALSYQTWYVDSGADLVANTDTLPYPITSDVVLSKARCYAYEWAESRKDVMAAKDSGANYLNLRQAVLGEFATRLKTLRITDKDAVDATMAQFQKGWFGGLAPSYNSVSMRANMGVYR